LSGLEAQSKTVLNNELNTFLNLQVGSESTQTRNRCGESMQSARWPRFWGVTLKLDGQVAKEHGKDS
jgi:hypothetical protein